MPLRLSLESRDNRLCRVAYQSPISNQAIAAAGGGKYFELDTRPDRQIVAQIVSSIETTGRPATASSGAQYLYGGLLLAAIVFLASGTLWLLESVGLRLPIVAFTGIIGSLGL